MIQTIHSSIADANSNIIKYFSMCDLSDSQDTTVD